MTSKDAEGTAPEGTSGSRWEPAESSATEEHSMAAQGSVPPPPGEAPAVPGNRWRPSRSLSVAASAAIAGLVIGGVGGWAAGHAGQSDDDRMRPSMVGFQHGDGDGHMPGPGGPGGPGVMPGQPQLGQDDDSTGGGQQS
jgi:hypothetical protein